MSDLTLIYKNFLELKNDFYNLPINFFDNAFIKELKNKIRKNSIVVSLIDFQEFNFFCYLLNDFLNKIEQKCIFLESQTIVTINEIFDIIEEIFKKDSFVKDETLNIVFKENLFRLDKFVNNNFDKVFIINNKVFSETDQLYVILGQLYLMNYGKVDIENFIKNIDEMNILLKKVKMIKLKKNLKKIKGFLGSVDESNYDKYENRIKFYLEYFQMNIEYLIDILVSEKKKIIQDNLKTFSLTINDVYKLIQVSKKNEEIYDYIKKLFLVEAKDVLNDLQYIINDISKAQNKMIEFEIQGELMLYKNYMDDLKFVFIHLLRNACDHGIESMEERELKGKNKKSKILAVLEKDSKNFKISISDDGKGLSKIKILKKAIEKGIISKDDGDVLEDREVFELIFLPNFSTKEIISEVSGRGVGIDVAKSTVEKLGGKIELITKKDVGTTFKIIIPILEEENEDSSY